jgi:molecular chaperone DnaJ
MASQDWFDKDFYAILGVSKDVTAAELKKVYRKLARKYHPDSNPGDAASEAKFKEVSEAHSVLSDPEQRREYDQIRAMGSGARFTAGSGGPGGGAGGFEDVFGGMFGGGQPGGQRTQYRQQGGGAGFEDIFGGMFGGGGGGFGQTSGGYRGFGGPQKGRDMTATTTLDFQTAVVGETISLQGANGRPMKVRIPAGVHDGQKIRLRGKGEPSPDGGEAGDMVLTIAVRKHPVFELDGLNLRLDVPVTFAEAALGATIEVPTLGGEPVRLRVAPGTPSGRVLRVKGRGVSTKSGTGDLLATVQVAVPSHLTDKAREAVEALAAALPSENPRDDLIVRARAQS